MKKEKCILLLFLESCKWLVSEEVGPQVNEFVVEGVVATQHPQSINQNTEGQFKRHDCKIKHN